MPWLASQSRATQNDVIHHVCDILQTSLFAEELQRSEQDSHSRSALWSMFSYVIPLCIRDYPRPSSLNAFGEMTCPGILKFLEVPEALQSLLLVTLVSLCTSAAQPLPTYFWPTSCGVSTPAQHPALTSSSVTRHTRLATTARSRSVTASVTILFSDNKQVASLLPIFNRHPARGLRQQFQAPCLRVCLRQ